MVSQTSIAATALLQCMGRTLFVAYPQDEYPPVPSMGSNIFLMSILTLLWDVNIIPQFFRQSSPKLFVITELLATIFVAELITAVIWWNYERLAFEAVRMVCRQHLWCEYGLMMTLTLMGAIVAMCIVAEVVCSSELKESMGGVLSGRVSMPLAAGPLVEYIHDIRSFVMGAIIFSQLTRYQRLLAVRALKVQLEQSNKRNKRQEMDNEQEQQNKQEKQGQVQEQAQAQDEEGEEDDDDEPCPELVPIEELHP